MVRCALIHGFAGDAAPRGTTSSRRGSCPTAPRTIALPGHGGGPGARRPGTTTSPRSRRSTRAAATVVVGYSLGARVALGLVAGGHAAHGVLIGVNPGIADDDASRRARVRRGVGATCSAPRAWRRSTTRGPRSRCSRRRRGSPARKARGAPRAPAPLDPEQLARSLEVMGLAAMPDYWTAVARAPRSHRADRRRRRREVRRDRRAALPCASFETIPGSGHDPTLEQPVALAAAIARAVQRLR